MDFKGFTGFDGAVFPPELREIIPTIKTLAEIKLLLIILDSYFQAGLDAQPMTFDQLQDRTQLSRQSVNNGLKALLAKEYIQRLTAGDTFAYEPSLKSRLPCHESLPFDDEKLDSHDKEYIHAWQSKICTALVKEFGVASRVAEDIAFKRDPEYVQRHIDYAQYEIETGFKPNRPAGYIVARIRDDRPMPLGYKVKEDEAPKTPADFGIGEKAPLDGVPAATDNHQRVIDEANGGEAEDSVSFVVRHHYYGFRGGPAPLPDRKKDKGEHEKWQQAGDYILRHIPQPWDLPKIGEAIDKVWAKGWDDFYERIPCKEEGLSIFVNALLAKLSNGKTQAPTPASEIQARIDDQSDPARQAEKELEQLRASFLNSCGLGPHVAESHFGTVLGADDGHLLVQVSQSTINWMDAKPSLRQAAERGARAMELEVEFVEESQ